MTTETSETLSKRQVLTKKAAKVATYYKPNAIKLSPSGSACSWDGSVLTSST
jgi:hypothetical protein